MVDKSNQGVKVKIKLDKRQAKSEFCAPAVSILLASNIQVEMISMPKYRSMHNKFIIVDEKYVVTGSFNFTSAAAKVNWENLVLIESEKVAKDFI